MIKLSIGSMLLGCMIFLAGCQTVGNGLVKTGFTLGGEPGEERKDEWTETYLEEHSEWSRSDKADWRITGPWAVAGPSLAVAGIIVIAVKLAFSGVGALAPGLGGAGIFLILSGVVMSAIAIAFDHPWMPLIALLLVVGAIGWLIWSVKRKLRTGGFSAVSELFSRGNKAS